MKKVNVNYFYTLFYSMWTSLLRLLVGFVFSIFFSWFHLCKKKNTQKNVCKKNNVFFQYCFRSLTSHILYVFFIALMKNLSFKVLIQWIGRLIEHLEVFTFDCILLPRKITEYDRHKVFRIFKILFRYVPYLSRLFKVYLA